MIAVVCSMSEVYNIGDTVLKKGSGVTKVVRFLQPPCYPAYHVNTLSVNIDVTFRAKAS